MLNSIKRCLVKTGHTYQIGGRNFNVNPDAVIPILYIGGRRCGKTTIMASIYENAIRSSAGAKDLTITACDTEIKNSLSETIEKLKEQAKESYSSVNGIKASNNVTCYDFLLYSKNDTAEDACVMLRFIDVPGEIYAKLEENQKEELANILKDIKVLLVAVDSVSLMESKDTDKNYSDYNIISHIEEIFDNLKPADERKLVLFVPVKCEKYYRKGRAKELIAAIENKYKNIIDRIHNNSPSDVVAITPVQTIGTIVFHHYDKKENESSLAKQVFFTCDDDDIEAPYEPLCCDQVLWYIFRFIYSDAGAKFQKQQGGLIQRIVEKLKKILFKNNNSGKFLKVILGPDKGYNIGAEIYASSGNLSQVDFKKLKQGLSVCGVIGNQVDFGYKICYDQDGLFKE